MNIRDAWAHGRSRLSSSSPTPDLDARLLLQHVLQVGHTYLIAHDSEPLTAAQETAYLGLLARAGRHEPIPYLTGTAPFFDLELRVTPAVLIPRPETEQLVELAVARAQTLSSPRVVDVGTGSGAIAIALALMLPDAAITAVDLSTDALAVARKNAVTHAPGRIQFRQSDLLTAVAGPVDLILANLPYVTDAEWTQLDDGVKWYEPSMALKGGADGLDLIRKLLRQSRSRLSPTGAIFLEIGWQQGSAAVAEAHACFPEATVELHTDFAGRDRIVTLDRVKRKADVFDE